MRPNLRAFLNRLLGREGEARAARFLKRRGMKILARNVRNRLGEIDLIARDGEILVFVEVKTRRKGLPAEAVTPEKQRKIARAAMHFLRSHRALEVRSRFDVVAIVWPEGSRSPIIEHVENAFDGPGNYQLF